MNKLIQTSSRLRRLGGMSPLLLALAVPPAFAEGPMNTDDAGTLDQGGMKVEVVLSRDDKERGSEIGFGYGLIENVEVGVTFAQGRDRTDDPSTKLRGTGFSVKWVPIQNDTGWSLGASLGFGKTRVNERATPDRFTSKEYSLSGLVSYRFENGQVLHFNAGTTRTKELGSSDNVGNWSIGYEYPLLENLQLTLDAFAEESSDTDAQLGLRYEILDGLKVYGAVGRGNSRSFGNLGLAWEF